MDYLTLFSLEINELLQYANFDAIVEWILNLPLIILVASALIIVAAIVAVIAGLVKACKNNRTTWKKRVGSELMYSFACGSGQYQRKAIFKETVYNACNHKWWLYSFAGAAYRIGCYSSESKLLAFFLSFFYIGLSALGLVEMIIRIVIGTIIIVVCNLVYKVFLFLLWIIHLLLLPLFAYIDKKNRTQQHCNKCFRVFDLPSLECSNCGAIFARLTPGRSGLLWARCSCGKFLPCNALSGRKNLSAQCPKCKEPLATAAFKPLSLQIIGGNSSGKTAYIASFQHKYRELLSSTVANRTWVFPPEEFDNLEDGYNGGIVEKSSTSQINTFCIVHKTRGVNNEGVEIYDIPDEEILATDFERSPLNLTYSDGIILMIDPLSVDSVREESDKTEGSKSTEGYSDDSADDIIIRFINLYSAITGRSTSKMTSIPVAILITKTDIEVIGNRVGADSVKRAYVAAKRSFRGQEDARNSLCRQYLIDIGLANVVNNIESVFSNVSYFGVSSVGHLPIEGQPFEPRGVLEPIKWIATKCGKSTKYFSKSMED